MDEQGQTARGVRCTVCGAPCHEEHRGTLQGNSPSDENGKSEHYLVHLCEGCFHGALGYLRQEHEIMNLFDYEPSAEETFGLLNEYKKQPRE